MSPMSDSDWDAVRAELRENAQFEALAQILDPNCEVERDIENNIIRLLALRDITIGEELTYRYKTVWFPVEDG